MRVSVAYKDGKWHAFRDGAIVVSKSTLYLAECDGYEGRLISWRVPDPLSRGARYAEFQKNGDVIRW